MRKFLETVIIGGGQAGLSLSYYLHSLGREHIVLEKTAQPGDAWRNQRWDSFTLVTPNWTFLLPGAEYQGVDPGGFMPRREIVDRFEAYVQDYHLPVHYGTQVTCVEPADHRGYRVLTQDSTLQADNVVVATGLFQTPKIPLFASHIPPEIHQIHSGQYRSPQGLPPGAVLVVGSAQSGCQIAEELYQAGRKVFLCVGSSGRVPRRYRERDTFDWLSLCGFLDRTPDKLPSPQARFAGNPHLSGKNGGHSLNLHQFYRDGVALLGRLRGVQDGELSFAPDLMENLAKADKLEADILKLIDDYISNTQIAAPLDQLPVLTDGYAAPEIDRLEFQASGIAAIIWAGGYAFDFSLVRLPAFDVYRFPLTERGVSRFPGLFFLGMPWLHTQKSGLLMGVGEDAAYLAGRI